MFERGQVIRSVVSEENLLRLDLLEEFNVPSLEKFSLNAAPEVRPVLLTFEHIEDCTNVFLRATEQIVVQDDPAVSNGKLAQSPFTFRDGAEPAVIMTTARSDSVAVFEIHTGRESLTAHSSGRAASLDVAVARPSVSESLSFQ